MIGSTLRIVIFIHAIAIRELLAQNNTIRLRNSGAMALLKDDIALTFFATVENMANVPYTIGLKMEKCCQFVTAGEMDCESMILHGGLNIKLFPKDVHNLTMHYTNMYLHGRNGSCSIKLGWRLLSTTGDVDLSEPLGHQDFEVLFNTMLPKQNFFLQLWQKSIVTRPGRLGKVVAVTDDPEKYSLCSSIDEDPTNGCNPVNCLIKYSGFRSFYNETTKSCQKTPSLTGVKEFYQSSDEKPTIILSPVSNKYFNVPSALNFTEGFVATLMTSKVDTIALDYMSYPVKSVCVNGWINVTRCECYKGWTSNKFPVETFNPNSDTYSLCDVRTWDGEDGNRAKYASAPLYILLVILMLLVVSLCLCIPIVLRRCLRKDNNKCVLDEDCSNSKTVSKVNSIDSSVKVISEVKDRREIRLRPINRYPTQQVLAREQNPVNVQPKQTKMISNLNLETNVGKQKSLENLVERKYASRETILSKKSSVEKDICLTPDKMVSPSISKKKLCLPKFSKSSTLPLPPPLIPVKVDSATVLNNPDKKIEINGSSNVKVPVSLPTRRSYMKLKFLMKEVQELSTKQMENEYDIDEVPGTNLDKLPALNVQTIESQSELFPSSVPLEFWEASSDTESVISTESTLENKNETIWGSWTSWLNEQKLQDELQNNESESNTKLSDLFSLNASGDRLIGENVDRKFESPNDIQETENNHDQKQSTPICCSPTNVQDNADVTRLFMKASERTESLEHYENSLKPLYVDSRQYDLNETVESETQTSTYENGL